MKIGQILNKAGRFLNDKSGCYTRKQCQELSIALGKDLVDIRKSGQEISLDVLQRVIKTRVPKARPNIITNFEDFKATLLKAGYGNDFAEAMMENAGALHFRFSEAKGIFVPRLAEEIGIYHFAHEFEHYMFNTHTLWRKMIFSFVDMITLKEKKAVKSVVQKQELKTRKDHKKTGSTLIDRLQASLRKFFGINEINKAGGYKDLGLKSSDVTEFLAGENYVGLTSPKRINAYIRAITRKELNPTKDGAILDILFSKGQLADEARAYKVADEVERYATGQKNLTRFGFISEIYNRTVKVLKKELIVAIKNSIKEKPLRKRKLPTNSFVGKKSEVSPVVEKVAKKEAKPAPKTYKVIWGTPEVK